ESQLRHLTQTFCQMFNDHNEVLEILLMENSRKFIQKVLNHTALDVELINGSIIEVKFCKEIDNDLIEFTDLNDIKGFIPIKIRKYNDKIWYMKDNIITNDISLHTSNVSNLKNIEIKNNYDLQFLNNKLIFKEHIFND